MASRSLRWHRIRTRRCCQNQWIKVRQDAVRLPDGSQLESFIVVEYCGAVATLALQDGRVLLVRQYRYPADEFTLEIPAGALSGTRRADVSRTAKAELLEEAGYAAKTIRPFFRYRPSPGSSNEVIHIVLATGLTQHHDLCRTGSTISAKWYEIHDVLKMINEGKITHSPTIIAMLLARERALF